MCDTIQIDLKMVARRAIIDRLVIERDGCLSEPITRANYLEKLFLLTEWEQHTHMEALEKYV